MTSVRILKEDVFHRACNLCVFSHVQKGTPGLTHTDCVLQRVSLGALSDVTVVLGMKQSICYNYLECIVIATEFDIFIWQKAPGNKLNFMASIYFLVNVIEMS